MSIARKILMGSGGKKDSTYVDDVFSTYLYKGNGGTQTFNNGVDLTKGGLVWIKGRNVGYYHNLQDNVSGLTGIDKYLTSNADWIANWAANGENDPRYYVTGFNNNGFDIGLGAQVNINNYDFTSWTFRKAKGFCDIVSYTGTGSARTVAHSLGSIPGMILIKRTDGQVDWRVYHQNTRPDTPQETSLRLNTNDAMQNGQVYFNDTSPTSSVFTVGTDSTVNANGGSYVAYIFGGGESNAATAKSVYLDGSNDYITIDDTSSGEMATGTGDFTVEMWVKPNGYNLTNVGPGIWSGTGNNSLQIWMNGSGHLKISLGPDTSSGVLLTYTGAKPPVGQWTHLAFVRNGNNGYLYLNGIEVVSGNVNSGSYNSGTIYLGRNSGMYTGSFQAYYSNVRFTTSALYTSSFKPPTEPLTNITNTKLLCCNNSSTTGSTVTPGTIAVGSVPVASSDSPFDDPEGFKFGEGGDQNIVKTGSYIGNGDTTNGTKIYLGFEPQWLLIKSTGFAEEWHMFDCMRGIVNEGNDIRLEASTSGSELTSADFVDIDASGFTALHNPNVNKNNENFVYMAIRRPDPLVAKPPEAGTDVFAMSYGNSAGTNPSYVSNFPVDFALLRQPATSEAWYTVARLIQGNYLFTNVSNAQGTASNFVFSHNNGWRDGSAVTNYLSWMWKRHAGFDVVTYTGNDVSGRQIPHSLNKTVEMMWVKFRNDTYDWQVYHKGLNGGTNPQNYKLQLNDISAESGNVAWWNNTAPTSTYFTVGNSTRVNYPNGQYIAMLFASVDGISSVGSFTGDSSGNVSVTTGFQPRFILIKNADASEGWILHDSLRGMSNNNDQRLFLNTSAAQTNDGGYEFISVSSTGFTVTNNGGSVLNGNNQTMIYYAHA